MRPRDIEKQFLVSQRLASRRQKLSTLCHNIRSLSSCQLHIREGVQTDHLLMMLPQ